MLRPYLFAGILIIGVLRAADGTGSAADTAWDVLHKAANDGNWERRKEAMLALSTIGGTNEAAVKCVVDALQDKEARVRQSAALALGAMKARQSIPNLKQALGDTGEVAFAAAKSLTDLGDPSGRDMLIAVLAGERKDSPGILTNAIRDAKKRLRHPEGLILMGAEDATGAMFGPPAMGIEAAKDTMQLRSKGAPGRAAAAAYLAKDPDPYAVTLLEWALSDDNPLVRAEAAKGLGLRGNAASIPKLQYLLADSHTAPRTMAAAAIIRLTSGAK